MSDARKCDICGHFWIPGKNNWTIRVAKVNVSRDIRESEFYDICADCAKNKIYPVISSSMILKEEFENG